MNTTITWRAAPWPSLIPARRESDRKHAAFRAPWAGTLRLLDHEVYAVGALEVTIQVDAPATDIRRDGQVRADARVRSPGVIVTFEHPTQGRLSYPCDRYVDWQDNVRAIALSLEALRAVDRHGVTRAGEQYAGFKALPAETGATLTTEQAATVIADHAGAPGGVSVGGILRDREVARAAVRVARARTHPDAGGSTDRFTAVGVATRVLEAHHGGSL